MAKAPPTTIDLARLSLGHGEGARIELSAPIEPLELGGQVYAPSPAEVAGPRGMSCRREITTPETTNESALQ